VAYQFTQVDRKRVVPMPVDVLPVTPSIFERLDRDKDGVIGRRDLAEPVRGAAAELTGTGSTVLAPTASARSAARVVNTKLGEKRSVQLPHERKQQRPKTHDETSEEQVMEAALVPQPKPMVVTQTRLQEVAQVEMVEKPVEVPEVQMREKVVEVPSVLVHEKIVEVPRVTVAELRKQV
jgi:hypothetical protein